uniref:RNase H type-1 domain-containing protein n=2 Tax=Oryza TaxID=4527 RepID=A0A0D3HUF3_9ORYZ
MGMSPLQAELTHCSTIGLHMIHLTDYSTIASTFSKGDFQEYPRHWSLRPILSEMQCAVQGNHLQVNWIPRKINRKADRRMMLGTN